ncbi:MAG: NAD(P)/FAD-dependent oxidoreductase, partial [Ruminococcus sp.]
FYKILKDIGHTYVPVTPALCPVYTEQSLLKSLKGIRVTGKVSLYNNDNKLICFDEGEVQFTEKTLSGICVFNLAAFIKEDNMYIRIDLLPHLTDSEVNDLLWNLYAQRSSWKIEDMLSGVFQKKMCPALFNASRIIANLNEPVYTLTPYDIDQLLKTIKAWDFSILHLGEWSQAQATSGGIPRYEIQNTLESSVCSNLYFAGEILDIVGECGGYNLAWAWCSGVCAARNAVNSLKEGEKCD